MFKKFINFFFNMRIEYKFILLLKLSTLIIEKKMYTMRGSTSHVHEPHSPKNTLVQMSNTFWSLHERGCKNFKTQNVALFFQKSKHANIDHMTL